MTYDRLAITAALVAAIDLLSKRAIVANLVPGQTISVVPPVARIVYVQNTRGAMGLFADNSIVLIALTVIACAAIAAVAATRLRRSGLARVAFGAVLGGALGNDLDRAVHGFVVDFIAVGSFYVFNLADAAITVGLIVLAMPGRRPYARQPR